MPLFSLRLRYGSVPALARGGEGRGCMLAKIADSRSEGVENIYDIVVVDGG